MDTLRQDIRFALRSLRNHLSVTLLAVVSLALAIAGNTVVFSLINGLLYRPLPFPEPDRIVMMGELEEGSIVSGVFPTSEAAFLDLREQQRSFSVVAGFRNGPVALSEGETSEPVNAGRVTPDFFPLLDATAQRGRLFQRDEEVPGNDRVAVLTDSFWRERFDGDPRILGETVEIEGTAHTIVGILREDFEFLDPTIRMWLPLAIERGEQTRDQRNTIAIARLADGVSEEQAEAEMAAFLERLQAEHPVHRGYSLAVTNLRNELPDDRNRQLFALLQGALIFVLLIACANIANLLLARGRSRTREIAIRSSLGAGSRRILRQLLTESVILASLGGALGLGLGALGVRIVAAQWTAILPRSYMPVVDLRVIGFTVAVALLAGLLFGIAPAFQSLRLNVVSALKDGSRGAGRGRSWAGNSLVVAEIALALVLLAGTGVLIGTFLALQNQDPGFETANLLTVQTRLPEGRYPEDEQVAAITERIRERLAALPGALGASVADSLPRIPLGASDAYAIESQPLADEASPPRANWYASDPTFFDTVGISLVRGRLLGPEDGAESEPVAVINRALAERHWPGGNPIGEHIILRDTPRRIVGVVSDVRHEMFKGEGAQPVIYLPLSQPAQQTVRSLSFLVRTASDPIEMAETAREAVLSVDRNLAVAQVQTLEQYTAQFFVGTQMFTAILGGFGFLALLLAMLGTYGVLAYRVATRTHEIGVRMALGAKRSQILRLMTGQGLKLAVIGLAVGAPGVFLVVRAVQATLSGFVAPASFGSSVAIAAGLLAVTLLASLLPARRAASIQPVEALHLE